jgi:hypothetical protein
MGSVVDQLIAEQRQKKSKRSVLRARATTTETERPGSNKAGNRQADEQRIGFLAPATPQSGGILCGQSKMNLK